MPPNGTPIYEPWPILTWMSTPLYKQSHQYAGSQGIFLCGRTVWPNDDWWINNYEKLGLEASYWVIASTRKGAKCADCKTRAVKYQQLPFQKGRGFYDLPEETTIQVVSLEALPRIAQLAIS